MHTTAAAAAAAAGTSLLCGAILYISIPPAEDVHAVVMHTTACTLVDAMTAGRTERKTAGRHEN